MKKDQYGLALYTLVVTAFPFWLPLILWIVYQIMGGIYGCSTAEIYERHWDIQFSEEWEEVYHADSGPSFHGDGKQYSIYENVSDESISDSGIPFMKGRNDAIADEFESVTTALCVADGELLDFKESYIWARLSREEGDYLVVLFVPEENKLFVAENLI